MEINFDSWWIPDGMITNGSSFLLKMIGSPSDTKEQDLVRWFKKWYLICDWKYSS
jgi:hypothetical protein